MIHEVLLELIVGPLLHKRLLKSLNQEVLPKVGNSILRVPLRLYRTQILTPLLVEGWALIEDVLQDRSQIEAVVPTPAHKEGSLLQLLEV